MDGLSFSDPLAPKVHAGTKTVTRRSPNAIKRYKVGRIYFVKEALAPNQFGTDSPSVVCYRTDDELVWRTSTAGVSFNETWPWKVKTLAAMYMPGWAARGWIRILDTRLEKLSEITNEDAVLEGAEPIDIGPDYWSLHAEPDYGQLYRTARDAFFGFWNELHKKAADQEQVVTRMAFERVSAEEARRAA